jgi:hypothetical protein
MRTYRGERSAVGSYVLRGTGLPGLASHRVTLLAPALVSATTGGHRAAPATGASLHALEELRWEGRA